jgi:hypothetical protein
MKNQDGIKKVTVDEFDAFITTFSKIWYQRIRFSTPERHNYYADNENRDLVAYHYDSYENQPEEFYIIDKV